MGAKPLVISATAVFGIWIVIAAATGVLRNAPGYVGGSSSTPDSASPSPAASPVTVTGEPIVCPERSTPQPRNVTLVTSAGSMQVAGTLRTFDAVTAVVAGPEGNVEATLARDVYLKGHLWPGSPVFMEAEENDDGVLMATKLVSVCTGLGLMQCADGSTFPSELSVSGDEFRADARLESQDGEVLTLLGPGVLLELLRGEELATTQPFAERSVLRVSGAVQPDRTLQVTQTEVLCEPQPTPTPAPEPTPTPAPTAPPFPAQPAPPTPDDDDDDDDDDNRGPGRGRGRGRGGGGGGGGGDG